MKQKPLCNGTMAFVIVIYLVSRCKVYFFNRGEYFFISNRSGFVRLFFVVI
ncbi:hypothetical protein AW02_023680 [Bacillus velezensis NJN-6]|nr:hypothetical protein AW02_023680 [Bacillus velezensis NJN-6]MBB4875091.1 hypothetical protein [Bacillus velezensis]ODS07994.1 hypothetical protein BSHJ18_02427 [Bacillus velezensis]CUB39178.1 hypothetical protein BN2127_JRS8_00912 [Bacillus amyloliquefaciens]